MEEFYMVDGPAQGEIVEKKSRFIANVFPVDSEEQALEIVEKTKKQYWDARHNCFAFVIGKNNEVQRFSDDGEPQGTAGKPILEVLTKGNIHNTLIIVTRYFGGIKLGAGGLTRAYSQAVADALKEANIVEKHLIDVYDVSLDYSFTKKFEHLLKVNDIDCINKEYDEQVTYRLYIDDLSFFDTIQDLTSNRYSKEFIKKEYVPVK